MSSNTAEAIKYLFDTYSGSLGTDAASFTSVATDIANFPSHFAILDQPNVVSVCEDIAWQARCALLLKNDTVFIRYLSKTQTEAFEHTNSNTEFKTLSTSFIATEDLVTRLVANWRENYETEDVKEYIFENNIPTFGLVEDNYEFSIYNIESLVKVSLGFWGIRLSNSWRTFALRGFYDSILLEAFDVNAINIGQLSTNKIRGEVERADQDLTGDEFTYEGTLASKAADVDLGNQPQEDTEYFTGDPNNPAEPAPAAPPDPTAGLALTDYEVPLSDRNQKISAELRPFYCDPLWWCVRW